MRRLLVDVDSKIIFSDFAKLIKPVLTQTYMERINLTRLT